MKLHTISKLYCFKTSCNCSVSLKSQIIWVAPVGNGLCPLLSTYKSIEGSIANFSQIGIEIVPVPPINKTFNVLVFNIIF